MKPWRPKTLFELLSHLTLPTSERSEDTGWLLSVIVVSPCISDCCRQFGGGVLSSMLVLDLYFLLVRIMQILNIEVEAVLHDQEGVVGWNDHGREPVGASHQGMSLWTNCWPFGKSKYILRSTINLGFITRFHRGSGFHSLCCLFATVSVAFVTLGCHTQDDQDSSFLGFTVCVACLLL